MFDISTVNKRYFEIRINGKLLEVEPPKVKTLKKIVSLSKVSGEEALSELAEAVRLILNKNKDRTTVLIDLVDELDLDQMNEIILKYFEWLDTSKNSPNL